MRYSVSVSQRLSTGTAFAVTAWKRLQLLAGMLKKSRRLYSKKKGAKRRPNTYVSGEAFA